MREKIYRTLIGRRFPPRRQARFGFFGSTAVDNLYQEWLYLLIRIAISLNREEKTIITRIAKAGGRFSDQYVFSIMDSLLCLTKKSEKVYSVNQKV